MRPLIRSSQATWSYFFERLAPEAKGSKKKTLPNRKYRYDILERMQDQHEIIGKF